MPDVFLSYSREDQAIARRFAEGLEREGLSVWWDQTLRSGEAYDQVTENALREARAVVVLWSKRSVESRWVRAEATTADRLGTLVPVMIEECNRPIMFELTHTAELSHWQGDARNPAWQAYVEDVRRYVQRASSTLQQPQVTVTRSIAQPSAGRRGLTGWWIAAISAVSVAILVLLFAWPHWHRAAPAATTRATTSVAVMPFANSTGDAGKDYIGDGIAEELIGALGKVPGLTVPSRTSSFAYKGRNVELKQVATDLGVATVLEGSVRIAGDRIRIAVQLIDARTDRQLWSESYERTMTDLFALQDELARKIVAAFRETMHVDLPELHAAEPPTRDAEAYALYLQGNANSQRNSSTSARDAIAAFQKALVRDPKFGEAYLGVATAQYIYGSPLAEVEANARRAAELKPGLGSAASRLLAGVAARRGRWIEAEEAFRSIAAEPNLPTLPPTILTDHAIGTQWATGQLKATLVAYDEAYRKAPAAAGVALSAGRAYEAAGRFAEAAQMASAAVAAGVDPNGRQALQLYADLAMHDGRYDDAAERMMAALSESARAAGAAEAVRKVYGGLGGKVPRAEAVRALHELLPRLSGTDWVIRAWAMSWFTQLGAIDEAYAAGEQLRRDFAQQSPVNAWSWLWSTQIGPFRLDPRFQGFTASLGMLDYWRKYGPPDDCDLPGGKLVCH